jgi:hypothetical protein
MAHGSASFSSGRITCFKFRIFLIERIVLIRSRFKSPVSGKDVLAFIKSCGLTDNQPPGAFQSALIHRCLPNTKKYRENTDNKKTY